MIRLLKKGKEVALLKGTDADLENVKARLANYPETKIGEYDSAELVDVAADNIAFDEKAAAEEKAWLASKEGQAEAAWRMHIKEKLAAEKAEFISKLQSAK